MNILLIDDHFCAREGISDLLRQMFPEITVFEAPSVDEGLAIAETTPLNLVLLDVQMQGKDGKQGLAEFRRRFPELCVVMFSGLDDRDVVFETLRAGAMGFIPKSVSRHEFMDALRDVLSGRPYLPASAVSPGNAAATAAIQPGDSSNGLRAATRPEDLGLTPREFEVLRCLVQGRGNKDIARRLGIEEQTVKNHLRPIFQKFGVTRRTELIVKAFERGVIFGPPEIGN